MRSFKAIFQNHIHIYYQNHSFVFVFVDVNFWMCTLYTRHSLFKQFEHYLSLTKTIQHANYFSRNLHRFIYFLILFMIHMLWFWLKLCCFTKIQFIHRNDRNFGQCYSDVERVSHCWCLRKLSKALIWLYNWNTF